MITYLCVSRGREIFFELFVKHFHHTCVLHAVHNLIGGFLSFLLTQILSFDDLRRSEMAFSRQPCEYCLVERVAPVVKGVGHFCVCAAKPRPRQLKLEIESNSESRTFLGRRFLLLGYCCFHRHLNLPNRRPHPRHTRLSQGYHDCRVCRRK